LADTDGSGTTDILYLGRDAICIFLNEAGNAWSDARVLRQFPTSDNQAAIAAVDLLGHGTACLVWSSPLPGDARQPLRYVDLMGGKKPHLLVSACNQLGSETRIEYASSTEFYLADKAAGTPWVTRLPFPVHVVARIDTYDRVGRNRFVSRYSYHHGHFDGVEREFRGFGRVEQLDTEELAALTATGDFPLGDNIDASSHVPPVLTKTWYHTGAWFAGRRVSRQFELEYYREGDPALGEGALTDTQLAAMLLEDTLLPEGLTAIECRQACRALKGSLLRREVYARDEREQSDRPYSVSERNYTIRPLQPQGGNRYAVFLPHPREAIDLHYERKLYMGNRADPRVAHALTLDVDDYGDVLLTANVAYGRRIDDPDPLLTNDDRAEQRKLHATFTRNGFTNPVNEDDAWCAPLASEAQSFELLNVAPVSAEAGITNLFGFGELRDLIDGSAVDELPYEDVDGSGVAGTAPFRRLVEHTRTFYRKNDLSGALALGTLEALALPFDHLKLTFTAGLAAQQYVDSGKLTAAALAAALTDDGGYVHSEGDSHWWAPSRRLFYSPGAGDAPAVELAEAVQHFFLARRYADPFGNVGLVTYDRHDLLIEETLDPAGNRVTSGVRDTTGVLVSSGNDYRVLQPALVMDANRNRSAVAYDTFGIVVGTAFMGKPEDSLGDSLDGFDADLTDAVVATHLADPIANAAAILQHATTRVIYDPLAFVRTQALPSPQPPVVCTLVRESHEADLPAGATTRVQCRFLYSDGLGRAIQKKTQAAPGPLVDGGPTVDPRWVGSGWTIYNNKGKVVRKYEPFFGDTPAFEFGNSVGVSPILFYDPIERVVGNLRPDHSWEKSVPDPWRMETWDQHDTLLVADPKSDSDVGDFFSRLPDANYVPTWYAARAGGDLGPEQQEAASQAAVHGATPAVALADSLGRNFLSIAHNKSLYASAPPGTLPTEEYARTRFVFDIQGNQRAVIDALGRTIIRYDYDLCGQRVSVVSMEAGARWELSDVAGNQIRRWDGRGHVFTTVYDALRRPIARVVRGTDAAKSDPRTLAKDLLFEKIEYGEGQADDIHYNLRGRTWRSSDGAGVETNDSYDFKGNLTRSSRRFVQDYQSIADWAVAQPLEPDTFTNAMAFDAQNRPLTLTAPDGSVASPRYDEAGQLNSLDVNVRGSAVAHFVQRIAYNAKGQRTDIAYGNGATTSFEYDPLTFRLTRATTTRPGGGNGLAAQLFNNTTRVQDLRYTTDAVGNVTRLSDQALATIFYANAQVDPVWRYTYDAIYRLIEAGGREHVAQSAWLSAPSDGNERDFPFAGATQFGDLQALRNYSERYEHDAAGNLTRVNHTAKGGSWTRDYAYEEASLVDAAARSNRLTRTTIGPATVEPYAYDEHGNVIAMPHLSRMAWDFKGQLRLSARQVVNDGTPETTYYLYAATGQRLRKVCERQNGTRRSDRVYLRGSELYRQFDGGGVNVTLARETLHVSETERHIAIVETQIIGGGAPVAVPVSALRYQIGNDLESVTVELDGGAALISYEEYTPYGATSYQAGRSAAEVSLKRYRYIAKERDEETGFSRHGVRYYASWLGRWTSCDPAGLAEGTNLYQYSRGSPCRRKDPDGTQSQDAEQRVPDPLPDNTVAAHGEAEAPARDVETAAQGVEAPASDLPTGEGRAAGDQRGATSSGDQSQTQGASTVDQPPPSGTMPSAGAGRAPSAEAATANQPATESNWFTRITKFTDSHELGLKSILLMVAFVAVALTLVIATARVNRNDPAALRAVQIAVTSGTILWALFLAGRDLFHWKIFGQQGNNDNRPLDIWSTVHTLAGVVMGLWRVPFPIVAVLTVAWEGFEMTVPGFGESEINANRIMDITVAWFGWLVAAGSISVATRQQMPWGFNSRSYTEDRLFGVAVGATRL
jgi:RHS repeat-associated protein